MLRAQEPGWTKIGATCSAGRRSLWLRVTSLKEDANLPEVVELCAGREGDDAYVKIDKSNPLFVELWDLFCAAQFAAET